MVKILDAKETGQLIKLHRRIAGLTQFQLAELIEIDDKQLGKIERGVHYPSMPTFLKILNILNISIEKFYSNNTSENSFTNLFKDASQNDIALLNRLYKAVKNI